MVASHGSFPQLDVLASFMVAQFVWSSKVDSAYGVGTRCPQSPPPRRHRHVTCTSSATSQYTCLHFQTRSSGFVLARGGAACANSTVHKKQEETEDFTIKRLCVCILGRKTKRKKQRTKPHARFAALLKRRWEGKSLKGRTQSFKVPLWQKIKSSPFKSRALEGEVGSLSTELAVLLKLNV